MPNVADLNLAALGRMGSADVLHWAYAEALDNNDPHRHGFFEACLVGGGGLAEFTHLGNRYEVAPGTLFVPRPGALHRIRNLERQKIELFWVCFTIDGKAEGALGRFMTDGRLITQDDGSLESLWRYVAGGGLGPESLRALARGLITRIAEMMAEPDPFPVSTQPAAFLEARRFIDDNLAEPIGVERIARHALVSERTLDRLFRRYTGMPPARFLRERRLRRAVDLLQTTDLPAREIGARVGFPDPAHFTRAFFTNFGESPGKWRKNTMPSREESEEDGLS